MSDAHVSTMRAPVVYSDGITEFEGHFAAPTDATERRSCVLLAHDWSGLNAGMRAVADRVAALGYACFAIDVYGKGVRGDTRT
jgi:dienelactone hydrolase